MGYKGTIGKTNFTLGEISPRAMGRFDADKPIYKNGAAILENVLVSQAGSIMFRPGTQYIAAIKNSSQQSCLYKFIYSITQSYVMEVGNLYIRFFSNVAGSPGQVVVASATAWMTSTAYVVGNYVTESATIYYCLIAHTSGTFATDLAAGKWVAQTALEIPTVFQQADIFNLQRANKADVMYICNSNYPPQKLVRNSATSFTISAVPFVRGPFLDTNITTTTITPSADTGTNITLTASAGIFQSGHVGSLWRVKSGVVKITTYTSATVVHGDVQAEPNGTAGNLATGPGASADWAEGAFSAVRGYPAAVTFHEQRLVYGGTTYKPQTIYGSVVGAYDNFATGTAQDADAWTYEIASSTVNVIRWLDSNVSLKIGTSGGTITAADQGNAGITPSAPPIITFDTSYGVQGVPDVKLGGYIFYLQANKFTLRQLKFDLIVNKDKSDDMTLLADHILRDGLGATQMDSQQSPSDRIWVIRDDGQIAVVTRESDQQVTGWCRIIGGESDFTANCNGLAGSFESVCILPIDGEDDQPWAICQRKIDGSFVRWVEIFTEELFNNYWEPVRLDASLSYDHPIDITAISNTDPMTVTAAAHGLSEGNQVRINGVLGGMSFLNGNTYYARNVTTNTFDLYNA